jgi:hypothetical protein
MPGLLAAHEGPSARLVTVSSGVAMVQQALTIARGLDVIAYGNDSQRMPLAERRGQDGGGSELVATLVIVIQSKIVL